MFNFLKSKIKDKHFKYNRSDIHPEFQPRLIFHRKGATFYFKSFYNEDPLAKSLAEKHPELYHWPEKPENMVIELKPNSHVRLPHFRYKVYTADGKSGQYDQRLEKDL